MSKNDVVVPPAKDEILAGYEDAGRTRSRSSTTRPDHAGGAPPGGHRPVERRDRRGRRGDDREHRVHGRAELDLHDGQLGRPRLDQADPPAGGHARPDGQPEGRDHRAAGEGQLHRGPRRDRVLHLDARRPQGPGRHRAPHGRLGLPDPAPGRRRAGRDHPRARTAAPRSTCELPLRKGGDANDMLLGRVAAADIKVKRNVIVEKGDEIGRAELAALRRGARRTSDTP